MRIEIFGCLAIAVALAGSASAYDAQDPRNCTGVEWNDARPLAAFEVRGGPRVHFVKSPYDDDFKAATCPSHSDGCRKESFLVAGDLALAGKTSGDFTCVAYQSPLDARQTWTVGWLPSAALAPVAPAPAPSVADWTGDWRHPGGHVEIADRGGKLSVAGGMTLPTPAGDYQNGEFHARVAPGAALAFVDEGDYGDNCRVRMQRVGAWLMVEDNGGCGGAGVTFTGLYRRGP
ncbi:hypothetical protein DFR50_1023 [Roseiarcus fermentans]|uniref:Uncharacterized protein n=1 Tax=Roseiarcus fermentans TaxID=1473586 RepID=A0A366FS64_9HYPH|nr:hypothetical protein [Roseiarcus fermentans]RBP17512.1 hypothetical protein DFR50_1023 [Roseiarcus fermentans]